MNPRFPASSPRPCGYHTTTIVPLGLAVRKVCPSPLLSRFKRGCIGNRKQNRPSVLEIAMASLGEDYCRSNFSRIAGGCWGNELPAASGIDFVAISDGVVA